MKAPSYIYHIKDHRWSCVEQGSILWAVNSSKLSITSSPFCLGFVETKPPSTLSFLMQPVPILHWEHPLPWEIDIRICYYTLHCVWKAKISCLHKSRLAKENFLLTPLPPEQKYPPPFHDSTALVHYQWEFWLSPQPRFHILEKELMGLVSLEANYSPICLLISHFLFSIYNPFLTHPSHVKYYSMHTTPL